MGLEIYVTDEETGKQAHVHDVLKIQDAKEVQLSSLSLMTASPADLLAQFKASVRLTEGSTIITSPILGGSLIITDLTISADRTNAALVTVQLTDDTETVVLYVGNTTDAPINVHVQYKGRVRGWENARLELVTVGAVAAYVTAVYLKAEDALSFAEWDDAR